MIRVIYRAGSALGKRAAERLAAALRRIAGAQAETLAADVAGPGTGDAVLLGCFGDAHLAPFVRSEESGRVRRDGYLLRFLEKDGRRFAVAAAACDQGVKFGAHRLLREIEFEDGRLASPKPDVVENPFLLERHVILSDPYGASVLEDEALQEKYCWELWPREKCAALVDALDEMGFNGLMAMDCWENYLCSGLRVPPAAMSEKVAGIYRRARENGQSTGLFIWGNTDKDPDSPGWRRGEDAEPFCWHDQAGRKTLLKMYDYRAERYAALVDYFVTHWGDPGGCTCGRCTIETAQHLHNVIAERMRARKPEMRSYFSLWMLKNERYGRWAGYQGVDTLLQGGILPPEVGLAQHGRFDLEQARKIRQAGREVGTFTWYLADNEIYPAWHVHARYQQAYFSSLPAETSDLLRMHSLDANCQGLNLASLYVGGALMWNPTRKADDLLAEFCTAVFGPRTGRPVLKMLSAIEKTRCRSDYGRLRAILHLSAPHDTREDLAFAAEDLEVAREARKLHESTSKDPEFVPRLTLPVSPAFLLAELGPQLKAIEDYARFRLALARCLAGKEPQAPLAARVQELRDIDPQPRFLIDCERRLVRDALAKLQRPGS